MVKEKVKARSLLKYTGGFIAWVIGSGFATGQEILQFFTSYGRFSYGVVLINLLGFLSIGMILMTTGNDNRENLKFNQFTYFCGKKLGTFYSWLIPFILILGMSVLISGAGATLSEYYGVNPRIGSAIMVAAVLAAYLVGFDRLVGIISSLGPVIIAFSIVVGVMTVIRDFGGITDIAAYEPELADSQSSPNWAVSAVLYLSLNFISGSTYYTALGASAENRRTAKLGALCGAAALVLTIAVMNTAILLNAGEAGQMDIPTLFLAKEISGLLGAVFSVVLVLGMFSSCSAMMWSACKRFAPDKGVKSRLTALAITVITFVLGLFSFSGLVSVLYPIIGYIGLIFIASVIYKGTKNKIIRERHK